MQCKTNRLLFIKKKTIPLCSHHKISKKTDSYLAKQKKVLTLQVIQQITIRIIPLWYSFYRQQVFLLSVFFGLKQKYFYLFKFTIQ